MLHDHAAFIDTQCSVVVKLGCGMWIT